MRRMAPLLVLAGLALLVGAGRPEHRRKGHEPQFQTSDRCFACHNGLTDAAGKDVSIGFDWRASIMANSSRDPYWQASVRRETIDHPEAQAIIEDECSICHMPIVRYENRNAGKNGEIFSHLPIATQDDRAAADGVSCSVCHQITTEKLGSPQSYNGGFVAGKPDADGNRLEFGPFEIAAGQTRIMKSSTEGYRPIEGQHIRKSEVCATCHTLITSPLGPDGKPVTGAALAEQMPYEEWLHSSYREEQSCQSCHMPAVQGPVAVARVFGEERDHLSRHVFVGANFFMQSMLNRFRGDLDVQALPQELSDAATYTMEYLRAKAATLQLEEVGVQDGRLRADVVVHNKGGHKLPTAYPARRAWLHVTVRDANHDVVFESGALRPDGSIAGNDNDADPARYEPHYTEITSGDQVEIFESILGDAKGHVTTGLLTGMRYLKDNRLLPDGFEKATANDHIAVVGGASSDPNFAAGGDRVRYTVNVGQATGPFTVEAELWYQPIGYRWANNLKPYDQAAEPRRFNAFFDAMQGSSAILLTRASVTR